MQPPVEIVVFGVLVLIGMILLIYAVTFSQNMMHFALNSNLRTVALKIRASILSAIEEVDGLRVVNESYRFIKLSFPINVCIVGSSISVSAFGYSVTEPLPDLKKVKYKSTWAGGDVLAVRVQKLTEDHYVVELLSIGLEMEDGMLSETYVVREVSEGC